jgi:serine phosphatase RsbU (regulator of sigma subunit)
MLVAHLVGVLRNEATHGADPVKILAALNEELAGTRHALATCLALRIDGNGATTLANAGHLAPYLNGAELAMEGALPLGALQGAQFSVTGFRLAGGDVLTVMTDGVVEAQDAEGRLFGFERIEEMLRQKVTAAGLAAEAQRFGQGDDITVLTVRRDYGV